MLKFAICDDSTTDVEYISSLVKAWAKNSGHEITVRMFPSAEAFLFHYEDVSDFDFLLLDIEMGQMNGVDLAKKIREKNRTVQIVFITGYPDFVLEGYNVSALHYLMKPVRKEKIFKVLDKGVTALLEKPRFVVLTVGKESIRIAANSILYAESDKHYVLLHTETEIIRLRMTVPEIMEALGDGFARCGRSFVVGLRYVQKITKDWVFLENGIQLPLGKGYFDELNLEFIGYLRGL